ncbi:MAG: hypothetical protein KKE39_09940 [Bacteroidetes bacterium]|nr:hypothetical protein [Bacteroidota bacterium]MBU1372930.1 hypothetical protein [Bacteroidota bacterium]MBU1484194.1 hypothetical protein [Bacteroidota bacterium]MBU1759817.1 hypothetical protein [Bacteroidota bacterium]MBU2046423.1 hypothetical protein [Bacteroidota bacterium]
MEEKNPNIVQESAADYEKAETDLLRNALKHSYTERFLMMTTLMKMDKMFRSAKITHQPAPKSDK